MCCFGLCVPVCCHICFAPKPPVPTIRPPDKVTRLLLLQTPVVPTVGTGSGSTAVSRSDLHPTRPPPRGPAHLIHDRTPVHIPAYVRVRPQHGFNFVDWQYKRACCVFPFCAACPQWFTCPTRVPCAWPLTMLGLCTKVAWLGILRLHCLYTVTLTPSATRSHFRFQFQMSNYSQPIT